MTRMRSLRWRLALMYAAVGTVMLLALLIVVSGAIEAALIRSTADRLVVEAGLVATDSGPGRSLPRATDLAAGDLATVLGGSGTAVVILEPSGDTLAAQGNGALPGVLEARLAASDYASVVGQGMTIDAVRHLANGGRVLVVAAPIQLRASGSGTGNAVGPGNGNGNGNGNGRGNRNGRGLGNQGAGDAERADGQPNAVAQLAVSLDPVDATLADLRFRMAGLGLGLLAAAIVAAWFLTRRGLRPLDRVARAAERISAGDLTARAALPEGGDEIGRLGLAFDGMADRVDATLTAQRQFAADASHELRTPLTVLGGYVDVLDRGELDAKTRSRTLTAMRREIDRLTRLSADLLFLTKLEAGGGRGSVQEVDLGQLVQDIGEAARIIGPDREIEVRRDGALPVLADPDRLTEAVMNLVDNAVRHSPPGGVVRLAAIRAEGMAVAEVSNAGTPIPRADLNRVFDRFFRGSNGTAGSGGHAGLGLAIVRAIAESSGGSVTAASDAESTRFAIRLPLAD